MSTELQDIPPADEQQATVKPMSGYQTNCTEKDAKGKPCWGQLKIWYSAPDEIRQGVPAGDFVFRCQKCWQVYHGPSHDHLTRGGGK